jgi:hypothetical protein
MNPSPALDAPVATPSAGSTPSLWARGVAVVRRVFRGKWVLGAVLVLVGLLATKGDWIAFPIRGPLRAVDITWSWGESRELPVGLAFRMLLVGAFAFASLHRLTSVILASSAVALLGVVPIQAAYYRVSWLGTYLEESAARLRFTAYANQHFVQNISPEPTFFPIDRFETMAEQLRIGVLMLGWGWYIAVAAAFGLLLVLMSGWKMPWRGLTVSCILGVLGVSALAGPLRSALAAQAAQDRGDQLLLDGNGVAAIDAYSRALASNPALALSTPFLGKASMAFSVASGGRHALGSVGRNLELASRRQSEDLLKAYAEARTHLADASRDGGYQATPLEAMLADAARNLKSQLWLSEGMVHANQKHYSEALGAYLRIMPTSESLDSFYLAHAYLALGNSSAALPLLRSLDQRVVQPSIHADIKCTLGDAYSAAGNLIEARTAYRSCRDLDKLDNFRAVKALSGT